MTSLVFHPNSIRLHGLIRACISDSSAFNFDVPFNMDLAAIKKTVFGVSDKESFKPVSSATVTS